MTRPDHDNPAQNRAGRRERRTARPIDRAALDAMALAYVARFATSAHRLHAYLGRKLRERGWDGEGEPPAGEVVARMVALGYIDDAAFARARGAGMLRRGLGARRIGEALQRDRIGAEAIGSESPAIDAEVIDEAKGSEHERRAAALHLAQKRRLGPFGRLADAADRRKEAERQVGTLVRAGHQLAFARALVDAADADAAQQWVDEADDSPGD